MSNIANIAVQLTANAGGVKRGVNEAKGALSGYGRSVKSMGSGNPFSGAQSGATGLAGSLGGLTTKLGAVGAAFAAAFSVQKIASSITASWELMDSQKELADQLGLSVKSLSGLSYISDVVGGDTEALSGNIARLQKLFGNAANGQKAASDTLAKYGLTAKQLIGLPLEQQMGIISDKFKTLETQEQKVVMATDLFGKSGASMINMLSLGSTEIEKMIGKAEDLGVVFDDEMAQKASDATDAMLEFNKALQGASNTMSIEFAPAATNVLQKLTEIMPLIPKLMKILPGFQPINLANYLLQGETEKKPKIEAPQSPLAPLPVSDTVGSMVDSIFAPPKAAASGSGVLSPEFQTGQGGKDYIDEIWNSMRAGGTGDPQLDRAKDLADFYEQEHKQRLLDIEQIDKKNAEDLKAQEEREKLLADQTKEYERQNEALEESKRIQGGFIISKAGRVAGGADFTTGGMITQAANSPVGVGSEIGQNGEIVSQLQEQTNYLRVIASKPQVASFA